MFTLASAPLPVERIGGSIMRLFLAAFWAALPYAFLGNLLFVLAAYAVMLFKPEDGLAASPLWGSLVAAVLLAYPAFMAAALYRVQAAAEQHAVTRMEPLRAGARYFVPCFIGCVAYCIPVAAGLVLLILPGLFLMVLLVFWWPALVLDGRGLSGSFKASARLVWGRWWRAVAGLLPVVTVYVCSAMLEKTTDAWPDDDMLQLAAFVLGWFAMVAVSLFTCSAVVVTYRDLKLRAATAGSLPVCSA